MRNENKSFILHEIGCRLRSIRKLKGVEIKQIASFLELTPQAYGNIENGKVDIGISKLVILADYFKVSLGEILNLQNLQLFNNYDNYNSGGAKIQAKDIPSYNLTDKALIKNIISQLKALMKK